MPENTASIAALAGAIGALVAAIVVSFSNLIIALINKKSEERKHFRELIIKAAIENYKEERSLAKVVMEKSPERNIIFYPLDDFIIQMSLPAELIVNKRLNPEELKQALIDLDKTRKQIQEYRNTELPEHMRKNAT